MLSNLSHPDLRRESVEETFSTSKAMLRYARPSPSEGPPVVRTLLAAALLIPAALASASAQAQYAPSPYPERPMPSYDEREDAQVDAPVERYGTADLHHDVDQTPPPPPVPQGYGYGDYGYGAQAGDPARDYGWQAPKPYARADQVDQGRADDAAHRADRAYTAKLNQRRWPGYNATPVAPPSSRQSGRPTARDQAYAQDSQAYRAELAAHQRAMQSYRQDQAGYADRVARWRARADACEGGNLDACNGPE